jgi:hypothetical protein
MSERDLRRRRGFESTGTAGAPSPAAPTADETVYDRIRELLHERGWVQGRNGHGSRLSLTAAIDVVVGVDPETRAGSAGELARRSRIARHLRELAGTANLVAWNDERARTLSEVSDLLMFAAITHPDD